MTAPFTNSGSSATIGSTEYSIIGGTTTSVPLQNNTNSYVWVMLDCSAMAAGDQFNLVVYDGTWGTSKPVATFPIVGAQGELLSFGPFALASWDVTLKKIAGTDRSISYSPRVDTADVNLVTWKGTAPSSLVNTGSIEAAVVQYGTSSTPGLVADDDEGEAWPRVMKLSDSTSSRRRVYFYVLSKAGSGGASGGGGGAYAPGGHAGNVIWQRNTLAVEGGASVAAMLAAKIAKNGGAAAAAAGTFGEGFDHGCFWYEFTTTELNTLGVVELQIAAGTTDGIVKARTIVVNVVAADQYDAVRLGLTALPNAAAAAAGGLFTRGSGAGQINQNANGQVDVRVVNMATDTLDSNALAATAVTEIQTGLATSTALAFVQADTDDIQTRIPAALDGSGFMKSQVKGIDSTALDLIFNYVVENGKTFVQYVRLMKSALMAKAAGFSGSTRTYRDDADTKARITATVDATGRTAVTLDGT